MMSDLSQAKSQVMTVYDLCHVIGSVLIKAWGDEWKEAFTPEYPQATKAARRITYKVVNRVPGAGRNELAHRYLREIREDKRIAHVYGRTYEVVLQFDIWSRTAREADALVIRFDEFMATYVNHFRQRGVILIAFVEQLEDERMDRWREDWYIRSLRYLVVIEDIKIDAPLPLTHVGADVSDDESSHVGDMSVVLRDQYYFGN